ncbi:unnamed protein product [Amoebophrya sp. A120]|nr:unnamed protein product [Amoebophrya sp. A120]|eukprot:GSA120T00022625001.1
MPMIFALLLGAVLASGTVVSKRKNTVSGRKNISEKKLKDKDGSRRQVKREQGHQTRRQQGAMTVRSMKMSNKNSRSRSKIPLPNSGTLGGGVLGSAEPDSSFFSPTLPGGDGLGGEFEDAAMYADEELEQSLQSPASDEFAPSQLTSGLVRLHRIPGRTDVYNIPASASKSSLVEKFKKQQNPLNAYYGARVAGKEAGATPPKSKQQREADAIEARNRGEDAFLTDASRAEDEKDMDFLTDTELVTTNSLHTNPETLNEVAQGISVTTGLPGKSGSAITRNFLATKQAQSPHSVLLVNGKTETDGVDDLAHEYAEQRQLEAEIFGDYGSQSPPGTAPTPRALDMQLMAKKKFQQSRMEQKRNPTAVNMSGTIVSNATDVNSTLPDNVTCGKMFAFDHSQGVPALGWDMMEIAWICDTQRDAQGNVVNAWLHKKFELDIGPMTPAMGKSNGNPPVLHEYLGCSLNTTRHDVGLNDCVTGGHCPQCSYATCPTTEPGVVKKQFFLDCRQNATTPLNTSFGPPPVPYPLQQHSG